MKKIISVLVCVLLVTVLCVPAFAEGEPRKEQWKEQEMEQERVFRDDGSLDLSNYSGNYTISASCSVNKIIVGENATLTIAKYVTVTVTEEVQNNGTINVLGTLNVSGDESHNGGVINVGCCGAITGDNTLQTWGIVNKGGHRYSGGMCENCDSRIASNNASTLSEGNVTLLVGIACLAVGFVTATLMNRRKKAAPAQEKE